MIFLLFIPIISFAQSPFMVEKGNTLVYDVIEDSKQQTLSILIEELTPTVTLRFIKNKKDDQIKLSDSIRLLLKLPKKFGNIEDPSVLYLPKETAFSINDSTIISLNAFGKDVNFATIFKGKIHIPVRKAIVKIPYTVLCHIVVFSEFEQKYVHTFWYHEEPKIPVMIAYTSDKRIVRLREVY